MLETIVQHAGTQPGKIAVVLGDQTTTYAMFAKLLLATRACLQRSLPDDEGPIAVLQSTLLLDWVAILTLRSLGRTAVAVQNLKTLQYLRLPAITAIVRFTDSSAAVALEDITDFGAPVIELTEVGLMDAANRPISTDIRPQPFGNYIEYTSGTTGNYKAILRDGAKFASLCERTTREFAIGPDSVFHFISLSPSCAVGSKCPVTVWHHGGTCVFDLRPDWYNRIADLEVNRIFVVPGWLEVLSKISLEKSRSYLRIYTGGGFASFNAARRVRELLDCEVLLNYAGTEFGVRLQTPMTREEDAIWLIPFDNAQIEVVDEDGTACSTDTEGQIRVRLHDCDPVGYIGDLDATKRYYRDGYFYTGDQGRRRSDGRVRILGRDSDVLNVGGDKRATAPFEAQARALLGTERVCLFSQQSARGEDYLLVAIEGRARLPKDVVQLFVAHFRPYFPRLAIHYFADFPRKGAMEKVDRNGLLQQFRDREENAPFTDR